jgi:hypothetical protein
MGFADETRSTVTPRQKRTGFYQCLAIEGTNDGHMGRIGSMEDVNTYEGEIIMITTCKMSHTHYICYLHNIHLTSSNMHCYDGYLIWFTAGWSK